MSYDLFLSSTPPPDAHALHAWFAARPHYKVTDTQAFYENPVSGVYFVFALANDGSVSFNLNYYRPAIFGLEAAPELAALVEAFGFDIYDPQTDGMGKGPFSVPGFLKGWNHGNAFGHYAMMQRGSAQAPLTLDQATRQRVWGWNRARDAYNDLLGSIEMTPAFVPGVHLLVDDAEPTRVLTAAIWPEVIPIALPEVDVVLAMDTPQQSPRVIDWAALLSVLERYEHRGPGHTFELDGQVQNVGLGHYMLDYDEAPTSVIAAHQGGRVRDLRRVAQDQVLDRELVREAQRRTPGGS